VNEHKRFDVEAHIHSFSELLRQAVNIQETRRLFESYPIDPTPLGGTIGYEIADPPGMWIGISHPNVRHRGIYLHGGGYVAGSVKMYAGLVSRLAAATRSWIFVPDLPLAPERTFPAVHDAAVAAFDYVQDHGPLSLEKPTSIFLAGDSCGAALAFATAMRLRDEHRSNKLSAIVGLSPILDMTAASESYIGCAATDKVVSRELTRYCAATYAPTTDPRDPRLSPLYGSLVGLPPVLLQVSEDEVVVADSTRAGNLAGQQGCHLEVQKWRGLPHVWHLLAPHLPDSLVAIECVGEFMARVNP
jgi:epsilon-lactone hydrolase